MHKKKKDGYIAGIVCLFMFAVFVYFTFVTVYNTTTAVIMGVFSILFGGLGFGSLWKPESVGALVWKYFERMSEAEEKSDSHNKQMQKDSSGVQVMTQGNVNINYAPEKKENTEKPLGQLMLRETRVINTKKRHVHNLGDLDEGDQLIGEASSTRPIDIELLNLASYRRLRNGDAYRCSNAYRHILATNINFTVPMDGTWYLALRNRGMKYAKVTLRLEYIPAKSNQ